MTAVDTWSALGGVVSLSLHFYFWLFMSCISSFNFERHVPGSHAQHTCSNCILMSTVIFNSWNHFLRRIFYFLVSQCGVVIESAIILAFHVILGTNSLCVRFILRWDPKGPYKPLHIMNPTRVSYVRSQICKHFGWELCCVLDSTQIPHWL